MATETTMVEYYARRAAEYEEVYRKPERQSDLARLVEAVASAFPDMDVLEVACGTGYWTQYAARSARRIVASDVNDAVLELARRKDYGKCLVSFLKADAYYLDGLASDCTAGFHGFWWSHIPRQRLPVFLEAFHRRVPPGAPVVMLDNLFVSGSNWPITRTDEHGNTYQARKLKDGSSHEVLKNFPSPAELREALSGHAEDIRVRTLTYYWMASYKRK
jgi:demethylmenaquinone methyltransferase/2-methoxy-6-polyprenyl-1,4-benzoquinol methylase